ncbi:MULTISPECIES: helix-turn-helix domain-containing protein [Streptomyces]|uniref:Helix-turn-helix domain-containing protein n=2 Tax=Streptomyces TaxID=1883 RepID=A0ABV9J9C8_9ACTN
MHECDRPVERLTRTDRLAGLARLDQVKVFAVRCAAPVGAGILRISRSTLYGLLAELRTPNAKDGTT